MTTFESLLPSKCALFQILFLPSPHHLNQHRSDNWNMVGGDNPPGVQTCTVLIPGRFWFSWDFNAYKWFSWLWNHTQMADKKEGYFISVFVSKVGSGFQILLFLRVCPATFADKKEQDHPSHSLGKRKVIETSTFVTPVPRKTAFQQSLPIGCSWDPVLTGCCLSLLPHHKAVFPKAL